MKIQTIKPYSKIQISPNITQYYLKNTMLQVSHYGSKETRTIVDLRTNETIKQFVRYICKLCDDFDCAWCKKGK